MFFSICPSFCSYYSVFGFFISLFVVGIHERPQNENENDNFWRQKWSVWDTAFFFPFSPFPVLFPFSSFTLPFPSPFLFPFSFSFLFYFPFLFLFLFFSFRFSFVFPFSFLFLSLSLSYSFLSLPLLFLFLFLFPFLAHVNPLVKVFLASTWKNDKRKKNDNVWKNHLKGLWVFTRPRQDASDRIRSDLINETHLHTHLRITQLFIGNIRQLGRNLETTHHWHFRTD